MLAGEKVIIHTEKNYHLKAKIYSLIGVLVTILSGTFLFLKVIKVALLTGQKAMARAQQSGNTVRWYRLSGAHDVKHPQANHEQTVIAVAVIRLCKAFSPGLKTVTQK